MTRSGEERGPDRGINDRFVSRDQFVPLFADIFDVLLYDRVVPGPRSRAARATYTEDSAFWHSARQQQLFQGTPIELRSFWVTEWVPSAPGRYFTDDAAEARDSARRFWQYSKGEYLPLGKNYMVLGGVGCLRLRSRTIDGARHYVLGGSSAGVAHQGVPLLVSEDHYLALLDPLKTTGAVRCTLIGSVQVLPLELALVTYERDVPRLAIVVDEITIDAAASHVDIEATIAAMYPSSYRISETYGHGAEQTNLDKSWASRRFARTVETRVFARQSNGSRDMQYGIPASGACRFWPTSTS